MGREERRNASPFTRPQGGMGSFRRGEVYDRFGRPLQQGDGVYIANGQPTFYRIQSMTPVMHPGMPAGQIRLVLIAVVDAPLPGGQPIPDLVKVQDASEFGDYQPPDQSAEEGSEPAPEVPPGQAN